MATPLTALSEPFVYRKDVVAHCLHLVRSARIHSQFSPYLALRLAGAQTGSSGGFTSAPIQGFFDRFLRVDGLPPSKPYIRPFVPSQPSNKNLAMNPNVPGSFAGGSLRSAAPLRQVIEVTGTRTNTRYAFGDNHWQLALEHLAFGVRVPALPLAVFLFRDYGFRVAGDEVSLSLALDVFLDMFGYRDDEGEPSLEFNALYEISPIEFNDFPFELGSS